MYTHTIAASLERGLTDAKSIRPNGQEDKIMLELFKKRKKKAFCWTERVKSFDLSDKKFTEALMLRACHSYDKAESVGPNIPDPESLFEFLGGFATLCAGSVAYSITSGALHSTDLSLFDFVPPPGPPKQAPAVVAFAIYVTIVISGELEADGLKLDEPKLIRTILSRFFQHSSREDCEKYAEESWRFYQSLMKVGSDNSNVGKWGNSLCKLVPSYVYSWTDENPPFPEEKYQELFGSLLKNLLTTVK
jgi:hypothetical protein